MPSPDENHQKEITAVFEFRYRVTFSDGSCTVLFARNIADALQRASGLGIKVGNQLLRIVRVAEED